MNRQEAMKLWKELNYNASFPPTGRLIELFANRVAEQERETCAKICEDNKHDGYVPPEDGNAAEYYNDAGRDCADAIRAKSHNDWHNRRRKMSEAKIEASELMPLLCVSCGGECEMVEETFDYAGTHCTNGMAGTHRTGVYVTNCCGAESIEGYPGWHVEYNQKPMPDRRHDYDYWHDDYDGAPDGNGLCGTADSVEAAIAEIGELDT